MGTGDRAALGDRLELVEGDREAEGTQLLDQPDGTLAPCRHQLVKMSLESGAMRVDAVAEQVHLAAFDRRAEFDPRYEENPVLAGSLLRLRNAGDRIMIGHREDAYPTLRSETDELARRKEPIGRGRMRVEINSSHRSVAEDKTGPRPADRGPVNVQRGSTIKRIAVRSSLPIVTVMNDGRQTASMPDSAR